MKDIVITVFTKWKYLLLIIGIRVLSVFAVRSWYVPDEYWQSLEVAHYLTFGYGYLTWEWQERIRNFIYPLIISILYKCLECLHLDSVYMLTITPRIFQAVFTSFAEYKLYRWCNHSKWTLFMLLSSWFVFYTGSRTLLNTMEYAITSIAITQFPWRNCQPEDDCNFLYTIGFGAVLRPTFIIPWIPLCIYHFYNPKFMFLKEIVFRYLSIIIFVLFMSIGVDSLVAQDLLFIPWNFLKINIMQGISNFYGSHNWFWYIIIGLPTILSISFIAFIFSVINVMNGKHKDRISLLMVISIGFTLVIYSMIAHKEFRFLLGVFPMILVVISKYFTQLSCRRSISKSTLTIIFCSISIFNFIPMYYFGWIHQSGATVLMPELLQIVQNYSATNTIPPKILFLMPCHSTPYYSHVHQNISMRFLTCEPDIKYSGVEDEAETFYSHPQKWLDINYFNVVNDECKDDVSCLKSRNLKNILPTHLVIFEGIKNQIEDSLKYYYEAVRIFHTHFPSSRVSSHIIVLELK